MTPSMADLFTDTAAILNLLDLRSIMGRQGALAQYLRAYFGQKGKFTVYFSGKGRSLLHLNTAQRSIFFSHYNLFLEKLKVILPRKARVIVLMPPGHTIILLKSN